MTVPNKTWLWGTVALLTFPLVAQAQVDVFRGGGTIRSADYPRTNFNPGFVPVPFGGFGGFVGAGYGNSYSASLSGLADLTAAQGQYVQDWQKARMTNQSVEQEKLKTRRMAAELRAYEQSLIPPLEDLREQERQRELRRAMGDPPVTEIYSGGALNYILKDLQDMQARNIYGPKVPLDPDILARINIANPTGGNVGIFKDGAKVKWPLALTGSAFEEQRNGIEAAMAALIKQGESSTGIEAATLRQYLDAVSALSDKIDSQGANMSLNNIMQAKRQLNELNDAGTALQSPDASNLFNSKWKVQGKSVDEMIAYMTKAGLKFGPASRGDEAAYKSLHYSMVTYDLGSRQAAAPRK